MVDKDEKSNKDAIKAEPKHEVPVVIEAKDRHVVPADDADEDPKEAREAFRAAFGEFTRERVLPGSPRLFGTPTNVVVLVTRLGNKYQYGDTDSYSNVNTWSGSNGAALLANNSIADSAADTAVVKAALANGTYRTAMLAVDKVNRGISTETLS